jgi:hypothetical protein
MYIYIYAHNAVELEGLVKIRKEGAVHTFRINP